MTGVRGLLFRLLASFRSRRAEADLTREISADLQLLEDSFIAKGMDPLEARFAARKAFGGVALTKERQRDTGPFRWIDESLLDFKLGARMLVKYPGLAIVGGLGMSLAIAIGAVSFYAALLVFAAAVQPLDAALREMQGMIRLGAVRPRCVPRIFVRIATISALASRRRRA
jgi:hypothetical protein